MSMTQARLDATSVDADVARSPIVAAPSYDVVELLDGRVRELVRREGVDPQRETDVVRRFAEDVVRQYDERSLTGAVTPLPDPQAVIGELVARVAGFGALQPFLDDPEIEEIWINDPCLAA